MLETHPFSIFIPPNAKYLILGSFAGKEAVKGGPSYDPSYDWYYGTKRNQFWPILEAIYDVQLTNRNSKKKLFEWLGIAIADIIYQCKRGEGSNLDSNLKKIVFNDDALYNIFEKNRIEKIYFTSRYVERNFKNNFRYVKYRYPYAEHIYLPSPVLATFLIRVIFSVVLLVYYDNFHINFEGWNICTLQDFLFKQDDNSFVGEVNGFVFGKYCTDD